MATAWVHTHFIGIHGAGRYVGMTSKLKLMRTRTHDHMKINFDIDLIMTYTPLIREPGDEGVNSFGMMSSALFLPQFW